MSHQMTVPVSVKHQMPLLAEYFTKDVLFKMQDPSQEDKMTAYKHFIDMAAVDVPLGIAAFAEWAANTLFVRSDEAKDEAPPAKAFKLFVDMIIRTVIDTEQGIPLDAIAVAEWCANYSRETLECCHWAQPKRLREYLTLTTQAKWTRVDEVPLVLEQVPIEKMTKVIDFFINRLLLKKYRKENRVDGYVSPLVQLCEAQFSEYVERAVIATELERLPLNAVDSAEWCWAFSREHIECCHWVSPRKFREFLEKTIGAEWDCVEMVPTEAENPPVDLKWYKNPEGGPPVQPCECPVCQKKCNSIQQYKAHAEGRTHKSNARDHKKLTGLDVEPLLLPTTPSSKSPATMALSPLSSSKFTDARSTAPPTPADSATPFLPYLEPRESVVSITSDDMQHLAPTHVQTTTVMLDAASDEQVPDTSSDSTGSMPRLDSMSPVHHQNRLLSPEVHDLSNEVSFALEVLKASDAAAVPEALSRAESVLHQLLLAAPEHAAETLLAAAVTAEDPCDLAYLAARLAPNGLFMTLAACVDRTLAAGFGERLSAGRLQCLDGEVYHEQFSTNFEVVYSSRSSSRARCFNRFVGELVRAGVLGHHVLQKCVERTCQDSKPAAEDIMVIAKLVTSLRACLPPQERCHMAAIIKTAAASSWYPERVHACVSMVA